MSSPTNEVKQEVKADDAAENLVKLRRKLEATEREKSQFEAKAKEYEKQIAESNKTKFRNVDPDDEPYDEPYVDEKRLNRKLEKIEEKFEKRVDEKAKALLAQERDANFLKANPDFAQVLTPEIIEKFANKHPEMAEPMLEMPDGFARQKLLYQAIKVAGVHKPDVKQPSIQETIDKNRKGPFYQPTGVGAAPYAGGGDFSPVGQKSAYDKVQELKARLRL